MPGMGSVSAALIRVAGEANARLIVSTVPRFDALKSE
jgi:hypothetical protein